MSRGPLLALFIHLGKAHIGIHWLQRPGLLGSNNTLSFAHCKALISEYIAHYLSMRNHPFHLHKLFLDAQYAKGLQGVCLEPNGTHHVRGDLL